MCLLKMIPETIYEYEREAIFAELIIDQSCRNSKSHIDEEEVVVVYDEQIPQYVVFNRNKFVVFKKESSLL